MAEGLIRSDALSNARGVLEVLPASAFDGALRRWEIVAVLQAAHDAASAEYQRLSRELGLAP